MKYYIKEEKNIIKHLNKENTQPNKSKMDKIDYRGFAGLKVKITTNDNAETEGFVWGFLFEDETEETVLEVWADKYIIQVDDIVNIVALEN